MLDALALSLAVLASALFILIPDLQQRFDNGTWAPIIVVFVWSGVFSKSVLLGVAEVIGSVMGAMYAYLVQTLTLYCVRTLHTHIHTHTHTHTFGDTYTYTYTYTDTHTHTHTHTYTYTHIHTHTHTYIHTYTHTHTHTH